jgi:tetratricopeptide (TPR) repeat protein
VATACCAQNSTLQDQIIQHERKLAEARAAKSQEDEASELYSFGFLHQRAGELQKALENYNQELPLRRALGDRSGEATALLDIGEVYSDLGQKQRALEYFEQALPIVREVGARGLFTGAKRKRNPSSWQGRRGLAFRFATISLGA